MSWKMLDGKYVRMQMLYRQDQCDSLRKYACKHGVSVTEAARRILGVGLEKTTAEDEWSSREEALKEMAELRAEILARNGGKPLAINLAEDIRQMRESRLDQIVGDI